MRRAPTPWIALPVALAAALSLTNYAHAQLGPELVAPEGPKTAAEEQTMFKLPDGFVMELVASEPEIAKPLNLAFDDQGRLWVTDTLEYPYPAPEGKPGRDSVKILSAFGPDGRAGKVEVFAGGLNIPIGLLPMPSGREALVHSIPKVYRMTDTDGDGKADKTVPAYEAYGYRDTHGMTNAFTWGFDGWIYACHGFNNDSKVKGADNAEVVMSSGNTYRMRADGSHAEAFSRGQVNPFGLAFDPLGNLYSSDCHSKPVYQLLRGAYYPSFGKPHDGLGFGPEMCAHDHGSTGIAGIVYYAAEQFPEAFRGNVFVGNVVTNRVNRDRVEWHGSSPKAVEQPDLVATDDRWFRPVDIEPGPDGALYIADFYNKIIGHYEVPLTYPGRDRHRGRIWRLSYKGPGAKPLPAAPTDYTAAPVPSLLAALGDPNLTVRTKAANQLVTRVGAKQGPVAELTTAALADANPLKRVQALWVLERYGLLNDDLLAKTAADSDRLVRTHAYKALAERSGLDGPIGDLARKGLTDADPFVQRAAAEALGRHADPVDIAPLLALRRTVSGEDNHLLHVVRMALRDQFRRDDAWAAFAASKPDARAEADVADVATGVPGPASATYLLAYLNKRPEGEANLTRFVHHVARHGSADLDAGLVAFLKGRENANRAEQVRLLTEMQLGLTERGAALSEPARAFALSLAAPLLASSDPGELAAGITLAGTMRLQPTADRLLALVRDPKTPEPLREEALKARGALEPGQTAWLGVVLADATAPQGVRERAAALLAANPRPEAQADLLKALPTVPAPVQSAIAAGLVVRKAGAEALLEAVAQGKASARLLQENRVAGPLANVGIPNLTERLSALLKGLPPADEAIQAKIARRRADFPTHLTQADLDAGAKAFETNCMPCHQVGGKGARIGPQLDGIGARGLDRLLEDTLDPSRNVDQAFRSSSVALKDGRVVSGLLLKEEGEVLVLADSEGKEVRLPKDQVEERIVSPLSPMPANFAEKVPEAEFQKLLAFLLSRRPDANPAP